MKPVFKSFVVTLSFMLLSAIANAQTQEDSRLNFHHLLPGIPEAKVRELIGNPTRIESFRLVSNSNQDTATFWFYGVNNWTLVFSNHFLDRIEISRDKLLVDIQQWADANNKEGIRLIYVK